MYVVMCNKYRYYIAGVSMSRRKFKAKRNFDGKKDDDRQINVRVQDIPEVDKRESVKRKHCEDVVEVVECPDISVILTDDVPEDAILIEAEEVPVESKGDEEETSVVVNMNNVDGQHENVQDIEIPCTNIETEVTTDSIGSGRIGSGNYLTYSDTS